MDTVDRFIENERDELLKHLSIDFFCEAVGEGTNKQLQECVSACKEGDTLALGNIIKDMVDDYAQRVAEVRWTPPAVRTRQYPCFVYSQDGHLVGGAENDEELVRLRHKYADRLTTVTVPASRYKEKFPEAA